MDLRGLVLFLRRWAWVLVSATLLAGGAAYLVSSVTSPGARYESTATVLVGPALAVADANSAQLDASRRVSAIYVEVAVSRPVLQRVISELDLPTTPALLRGQLTVTTPEDPPIISVTASATEPGAAAALANEVVRQLEAASPALATEEERASRFIQLQIGALEEEIASLGMEVERLAARESRTSSQDAELGALRDRLADQRSTYAALVDASSPSASTLLTVIEEAVANPIPLPGNRVQMTIFAALVGFVLASGVSLLMEHLDDTVKSDEDIARASGFPNLADIAPIPSAMRREPGRLRMEIGRDSLIGENFQALRTSIELLSPKPVHSLLVTSALRGEGKTTVAANLAVVFAQAGREVLLVDADLRRPALHRHFDLANGHGLSDLLRTSGATLAELVHATSVPRLQVLPAGIPPPGGGALVGSPVMKDIITRLRRHADLVIVDSPSILAAAESSLLASCLDRTLLVIAAGRTSVESLEDSSRVLQRAKANVIGTVLNRMPTSWRGARGRAYVADTEVASGDALLNRESSF